jgi:hypothetical protein
MFSLEHLLGQLQSPDNVVRQQAEEILSTQVEQDADQLIDALIEFACQPRSDNSEALRVYALVLFRRICFVSVGNLLWKALATTLDGSERADHRVWEKLRGDTKTKIQQHLLSALRNIGTFSLSFRLKLVQAVSELAREIVSLPSDWPELLQFIFEAIRLPSSSENLAVVYAKCAALELLAELLATLNDALSNHADTIKQWVGHNMADKTPGYFPVRLAALKCLRAYVEKLRPHEREFFINMIPVAWEMTAIALALHDEDGVTQVFDQFIMLAEKVPTFFKSHLDQLVVGVTQQLIANRDLEPTLRQSALEFLTILAEKMPSKVTMNSKHPHQCSSAIFVQHYISTVLAMMTEVEDEVTWHTATDTIEDDDVEANHIAAEMALDRVSCALGGKAILPIIFQSIPNMLQSPHWEQRSAALLALSVIMEGCKKMLEKELGKLVNMTIPYIRDPHPRVRYACINCLGQMCTDFGPKLQQKYHAQIMPALLMAMAGEGYPYYHSMQQQQQQQQQQPQIDYPMPHPRVQTHAASALVNFCESVVAVDRQCIEPYLEKVLESLFRLLQSDRRYVQQQAIQSIASIAIVAKDHFVRFYDIFMPLLKAILLQQQVAIPSVELLDFRGHALKCAILIGEAVGKERFFQDAHDIMKWTCSSSQDTSSADSQLPSHIMMDAMMHMSRILQKDFIPYLPWMMPHLMVLAQAKAEITLMPTHHDHSTEQQPQSQQLPSYHDDSNHPYSEQQGWDFVEFDGQKIGIRTSAIEEKQKALEMLTILAQDLKEDFREYAEPVLQVCLPMFKFFLDNGVRIAALNACPALLACLKAAVTTHHIIENRLSAVGATFLDSLIECLSVEPELQMIPVFLDTLNDSMDVLGIAWLTDDQLQMITVMLGSQLQQVRKRFLEQQQQEQTKDEQDEVVGEHDDDEDYDEDILRALGDLIRTILKFKVNTPEMTSRFVSLFEQLLLPTYASLLTPITPAFLKQWALCTFDDLIENLGSVSYKYHLYFLRPMIEALSDYSHSGIRQTAAYGIGVCAMYGGEPYIPTCIEAIPHLVRAIQQSDARDEINLTATENCVSALGKIYRYFRVHLGNDQQQDALLEFWMSQLPIIDDTEEAEVNYPFLCDLMEMHHPVVMHDVLRLVSICARTLGSNVLASHDEIRQRMILIFKYLMQTLSAEQQKTIWSTLSEDLRESVAVFLL